MENNEIYIDGVNVAGCCYYEPKNDTGKWCDLTCTRDKTPVFRCDKMPNCHYKQLKRLEQENKDFEILAKSLYKRIEELEKENEALAFRERLYKADYEASEQENKENIHYLACMTEQRNKLKIALEEIKNYCNRIEQGSVIGTQDCLINSIKNITNEVLGNN